MPPSPDQTQKLKREPQSLGCGDLTVWLSCPNCCAPSSTLLRLSPASQPSKRKDHTQWIILTSGTSTLTKSQVVSQIWRTPIFLEKQLLLLWKWCKIKEKDIPWIMLQKSISFDYFAVFLKGNPNSTYLQAVMESYGFPTSKAEERIVIGPQLSHGLNNQSVVEFPFNQHLKTACNDIISIWCFVYGWKSDIKMITIKNQNFILMADSSD